MSRPPAGRLVALFALMAFAFAAISVRLVVLQVSQAKELQDRAFDQRVSTIDLPAQRGQILDRNGARLALSTPADDVYADPQLVDDPWGTATRLSPLLEVIAWTRSGTPTSSSGDRRVAVAHGSSTS